jgi:hypothetical protein
VAHLDWRLRIHVISLRELALLQRSLCSIDDVGAFKARGFPDAWPSTVHQAHAGDLAVIREQCARV